MNLTGKACILVEKRTYKPAGWKRLKETIVEARFTKKRIYVEGVFKRVFNRETGTEIQTQECRINQSYRYSVTSTMVVDTQPRYVNGESQ